MIRIPHGYTKYFQGNFRPCSKTLGKCYMQTQNTSGIQTWSCVMIRENERDRV